MELNSHLKWLRKEIQQYSEKDRLKKESKTKKDIEDWLLILFTNINNSHIELDKRKIN